MCSDVESAAEGPGLPSPAASPSSSAEERGEEAIGGHGPTPINPWIDLYDESPDDEGWEVEPFTVLDAARRLVYGDRRESYGHPYEDFTATGRIWGALLGLPDIPPAMVGLMMAALKIRREAHKPGRDNLVDLAGYAAAVELVREWEERGGE